MTEEAAVAERPAETASTFTPAKPRGVLKTGMPKDGYWVIAGLPKGGKTSLVSSIPGAFILETEKGGADRVSGWIQEVNDLVSFRQALGWAFKAPEVKTIVIDTLDEVLAWLGQETAAKYGLDSISDKREGINGFAVWDTFFTTTKKMTIKFKECGKLVLLTCHFKEPKLDSDGKLVVTQSIEAPSSKISSQICSHADVIGVCAKKRVGDKSRYEIRFHGDGVVGAYGSRCSEIEDKTFLLPKVGAWSVIEEAFKNPAVTDKQADPAPKETKPAKTGRK